MQTPNPYLSHHLPIAIFLAIGYNNHTTPDTRMRRRPFRMKGAFFMTDMAQPRLFPRTAVFLFDRGEHIMDEKMLRLIETLEKERSLSIDEYEYLIGRRTEESTELLRAKAESVRKQAYGNAVYVRGLIEISSFCKNDCLYCGLRRSNKCAERYRLSKEEILECCREGHALGLRTFVLQGGEDMYFSDEVVEEIVREIKRRHPDCAVTLSLGERSRESYQRLHDAGADRYLLRHETADKAHYSLLHPKEMSFENRMECLHALHSIGYQTGCGIMVSSPGQTVRNLAQDMKFIETFGPEMCGVGPFIPHHATPFKDEPSGTVELTCFLLSVIRLIHPSVLLPATTALGSIDPVGREKGILSGANVVMPNLSPASVRKKYELYNNKLSSGAEAAENLRDLERRMEKIGYRVEYSRGDCKR